MSRLERMSLNEIQFELDRIKPRLQRLSAVHTFRGSRQEILLMLIVSHIGVRSRPSSSLVAKWIDQDYYPYISSYGAAIRRLAIANGYKVSSRKKIPNTAPPFPFTLEAEFNEVQIAWIHSYLTTSKTIVKNTIKKVFSKDTNLGLFKLIQEITSRAGQLPIYVGYTPDELSMSFTTDVGNHLATVLIDLTHRGYLVTRPNIFEETSTSIDFTIRNK